MNPFERLNKMVEFLELEPGVKVRLSDLTGGESYSSSKIIPK